MEYVTIVNFIWLRFITKFFESFKVETVYNIFNHYLDILNNRIWKN